MSFYRRVLQNMLQNDNTTIDDIIMNSRALTIAYIMKTNNLFDEKLIRVGIVSVSEATLMKSLKIEKPTNNEIYDLLYYLDSINELENYMSMNDKLIPTYDRFYEDMNRKLGLSIAEKKLNIEKVCPKCKLIPYYDFDDMCDLCNKNYGDLNTDEVDVF